MKLTEQHVSESDLNAIISYYRTVKYEVGIITLSALLELKQRRAEDRQLEYESNPALDPCNQPENIR
jgi:hypothetical protein